MSTTGDDTAGAYGEGHAGRLYGVAQALTAALTPADVADVVFGKVLADLGAMTAGFWLVEGEVIRFSGGAGHTEGSPERVGPIPLDSDLPAAMAVRLGEVVAYGSAEERNARWPSLADMGTSAGAVVVLPLKVEDRTLGCLHIGYPEPRPAEWLDIPLMVRIAELCAAALDRARLYERERAQREQLEFFSDATRVLIQSLDPVDVVQALVDTAVPRLADWCAVLTPAGDELRVSAVRIKAAEGVTHGVAEDTYAISGDSVVARCFRTGEMQVVDPLPSVYRGTLAKATARAITRMGLRSALAVPIEAGGQPIGVLSLAFADEGVSSNARIIDMAAGLALRAGVALHNASVFEAQRTVARTLTEALLPATTPRIEGYESAVEYLPSAGDVAGDWYDLLDLGSAIMVGVGDAAGHGIPAATLMAELRNAARGLAAAGHGPAAMLDGLALLAARDVEEAFATAIYAMLSPATHDLAWATAGHPPPLLLRDGSAVFLDHGEGGQEIRGLPIAPGMSGDRSEQHLRLQPGDTVVLYTDGVVERRGASLDDGLGRLASLVKEMQGDRPAVVVDRIVGELCADAFDDCCILVLQRSTS